MRIVGEWRAGEDARKRPVLRAEVQAADGTMIGGYFLVDSGADRTVFSTALLNELHLPPLPLPEGVTLEGVGGAFDSVVVQTVVHLPCDDGNVAKMNGQFAAMADDAGSELSILGRDILDFFDLILGRRKGEVLLLAPPHRFHVTSQ